MSALDLTSLSFEDATADEAKATRTRTPKVVNTPFVDALKNTLDSNTWKKVSVSNDAQAEEVEKAVKSAARYLEIGYRLSRKGNVVLFKGAEKKTYVLTTEGRDRRVKALKAAAAKRKAVKVAAAAKANGSKTSKAS